MNFFKFLCFFILTISVLSCSTNQISADAKPDPRSPSSVVMCENLFDQKSANVKTYIEEATKKIVSHLKFTSELLPASTTEAFWDTVVQLADNNDSKIQIESNKLVLTKNYNNNFKIHSTYNYDSPSNSFIISKLEYSTSEMQKQLITNSPIDPATNKFKSNLFVDIESVTAISGSISLVDRIDYKVFEKIENEKSHLNLFTSYELKKLYNLPPATRSLKYNSLSRARALRKFFTSNILNDYLYTPVKFIAVSIVSVFIISHVDFVKNIVSTSNQTPNWVAPSVVKMAIAYPKQVQPELVSLIKRIEYQEKSENANAEKVQKLSQKKADLVQIDEADQFSIEVEPRTKKTYFFVSHQKESGTIDIYATEINPTQYPNLISYFKLKSK